MSLARAARVGLFCAACVLLVVALLYGLAGAVALADYAARGYTDDDPDPWSAAVLGGGVAAFCGVGAVALFHRLTRTTGALQ